MGHTGEKDTRKVNVGIIGTGRIGTDLLMKVRRSRMLECSMFAGNNPKSETIQIAKSLGVRTSVHSIEAFEQDADCASIVFDATSVGAHLKHAPILKRLGKFTIDLTPSRVGMMCIPILNLRECMGSDNVNLVTCGGQAAVPIACAVLQSHPDTRYIEVVASIASKSAGAGTRANIDEYTQTTKDAISHFSGVPKAKAIIILNPAEPPVLMHNTIYAQIDHPDMEDLRKRVEAVEKQIQEYVPGYKVVLKPVQEENRVTTVVEVTGAGDYLPAYSGNLDIITSAAVRVAEEYARTRVLRARAAE